MSNEEFRTDNTRVCSGGFIFLKSWPSFLLLLKWPPQNSSTCEIFRKSNCPCNFRGCYSRLEPVVQTLTLLNNPLIISRISTSDTKCTYVHNMYFWHQIGSLQTTTLLWTQQKCLPHWTISRRGDSAGNLEVGKARHNFYAQHYGNMWRSLYGVKR